MKKMMVLSMMIMIMTGSMNAQCYNNGVNTNTNVNTNVNVNTNTNVNNNSNVGWNGNCNGNGHRNDRMDYDRHHDNGRYPNGGPGHNYGYGNNYSCGNSYGYGNSYSCGGNYGYGHNHANDYTMAPPPPPGHNMSPAERRCMERDMQSRNFRWTRNEVRMHRGDRHVFVREKDHGRFTGHLICDICGYHTR